MEQKSNGQQFLQVLKDNGIDKLFHFTDRSNLESIIKYGGLYSWADCDDKGITINRPGGSDLSKSLDKRYNLEYFVRLSFCENHPMKYVAMNDGRITNPVLLEIDPKIVMMKDVKFSDKNAARNDVSFGEDVDDLKRVHFDTVKKWKHFDLDEDEKPYFQAEVLVPNFLPLDFITNIRNFGIVVPAQPVVQQPVTQSKPVVSAPIANVQPVSHPAPKSAPQPQQSNLLAKKPYTADITRATPTAFIFLIDQSASMNRTTTLYGEDMSMSEAVARIVNSQLEELVLRCMKTNETRHYFDIALIGYGAEAYSAWNGALSGRDFVSPEDIQNNPYKRIITRVERNTPKGKKIKETETDQWLEARHDGNWTRMDLAFKKAGKLLEGWMEKYKNCNCYPPTIINITDGQYNGTTDDEMSELANDLKSMFTNDGNVILFNIHIAPGGVSSVALPVDMNEVGTSYGKTLCRLSSLLPERYNADIALMRNDNDPKSRHYAMAENAGTADLIKLMSIGTPTNIKR